MARQPVDTCIVDIFGYCRYWSRNCYTYSLGLLKVCAAPAIAVVQRGIFTSVGT